MKRISLCIALFCVLVLALTIYMFVDSFWGSANAEEEVLEKAKQYIAETYPNRDFEIEKVYYAFKDNCYYAKVKSHSSRDTYFKLAYDYRSLAFRFDSYESDVLSGRNTKIRLDAEYDALFGETCKGYLDIEPSTLTIDAEYNVAELGEKYGQLEISVQETQADLQTAAVLLQRIDKKLQEQGIGYQNITCIIEAGEESFEIYDVTKEHLCTDDVLSQLDTLWQAQERQREEVRASWAAND